MNTDWEMQSMDEIIAALEQDPVLWRRICELARSTGEITEEPDTAMHDHNPRING